MNRRQRGVTWKLCLAALVGSVSVLASWSCSSTTGGTDESHHAEPTISTLPPGQNGVAVVFVNEYGSAGSLPALRIDGSRLELHAGEGESSRSSYNVNLGVGMHTIETETSTGATDQLKFNVTRDRIWIVAIYWGPSSSGDTPAVELFATHEVPTFQ